MKSDNNQQKNMENSMNCHIYDSLLIDFIDGALSHEKSREIQIHIDNCPGCRNYYRLLLDSKAITVKLHANKNEYVKGINNLKQKQGIGRIKEIIDSESPYKQKSRSVFAFPPRYWSYASTAAGIAVLLFVAYLFFGPGNSNFKNAFFNLTNINGEFPENDKGYKGLSDLGTDSGQNDYIENGSQNSISNKKADASGEAADCTGNTSSVPYDSNISGQDAITTASIYTSKSTATSAASQSSSTSTKSSSSASPANTSADQSKNTIMTSRSGGGIKIESGNSQELWLAIQGFVSYHEITNNENSYFSLVAYPFDIIQTKMNTIAQIAAKMNLTAKFEIISGENTQKLVEYISEENAILLSKNAVSNNAGFLVISIGR